MNTSLRLACSLAVTILFVGCDGGPDDPSMTGTEEAALVVILPDGGPVLSCPAPKVLICHIPPGNPANAHTICVGKPAEKAHRNHGDVFAACGPTGAGGGAGGIGGAGGGGSSGAGGGSAATDGGMIN